MPSDSSSNSLSYPHPCEPSASLHYQRLLVLIGFDAADKVGLAVGKDFHQLVQRLLELAC